ncbi:MAG: hypothetical protein Q8L66_11275 [Caulobacter sp.]|nr:hypothetical protein [Caulobacter sp.]
MPPPEKPKPSGGSRAFGGFRNRQPLKLLAPVRGDGLLRAGGKETPVSYEIDLYQDGDRTVGNGAIDADLSHLADTDPDSELSLTLEDGVVVLVTLDNIGADGADIELHLPESGFPTPDGGDAAG